MMKAQSIAPISSPIQGNNNTAIFPSSLRVTTSMPLDEKSIRNTILERDAIPAAWRYHGMEVKILNVDTNGIPVTYQLNDANDLTNTGWTVKETDALRWEQI